MLRPALIIALLPLPALGHDLTVAGGFQQMMHSGKAPGLVALDTLAEPGAWGVGALAGLTGEVVIADGTVLISRGADPLAAIGAATPGDEAALLAYGTVADWRKLALPHDMDAAQLAHFISRTAGDLSLEAGFPIRLIGTFPALSWHVVTGMPPTGSGHGGNQANTAMNLYPDDGASGEIVGVFAGSNNAGAAAHPGEALHLHYLSEGREQSGHIDDINFAAGTELWLPVVALEPDRMAGHDMAGMSGPLPTEGGQSAFAAIGEVVALLMADPATDWSTVDIEGLRQHLMDMDNVTLRAEVAVEGSEAGVTFLVTSEDPTVQASIRRMVAGHAATMNGMNSLSLIATEIEGGSRLVVSGPADDMPRVMALGFIGVMTLGMHHQAHHLAVASGQNPHP